ncbi:MAG: hypothetical protein QG559_947 [Campylobacterota bacterium]|nr:hypothetical protein [Campylobacterota bacterium]
MSNIFLTHKDAYYKNIKPVVADYAYRGKRYHIDFALAIGFCDKNINLCDFIQIKRKTDKVIPLENNLCCIIFDCVDAKRVESATQNLKKQMNTKCNTEEFFIEVVTFSEYENDLKMFNYLFDDLEHFLLNKSYKTL